MLSQNTKKHRAEKVSNLKTSYVVMLINTILITDVSTVKHLEVTKISTEIEKLARLLLTQIVQWLPSHADSFTFLLDLVPNPSPQFLQ